jgi:MFS family permease
MTWRLFRQDPAVRTLVGSVPLSVYFGFFFGTLVAPRAQPAGPVLQPGESGWLAFVIAVLWVVSTLFAVLADVTARCASLSLTLPIEPRELWLVRIVSLLYAGLTPVAIVTVMASLRPLFPLGAGGVDLRILGLGAQTAAGLTTVILLSQSPRPELDRIPARPGYIVFVVAVVLTILAGVLLIPPSVGFTVSLLLVSGALGVRIYWLLPSAFVVAPARPQAESPGPRARSNEMVEAGRWLAPPRDGARAQSSLGHRWLLHRTVWRVLMHHPLTYLGLGIAVFFGYRLVPAYFSGWDLIPYFLVIVIYIGALLFFAGLRMYPLDPLPISRKLLFAHAVLTVIFGLALGVAVGGLHFSLDRDSYAMIGYSENKIRVPADCWELARDGEPPRITSPWGESHVPNSRRLLRGSRAVLFNPYDRGEDSSVRFVHYQLAKAVEEIHGVPAPQTETLPGREANSAEEACCRTVAASAGRGSESRSRTLATLVFLFGLIAAVSFALGLQQFRTSAPPHLFPWFLQGFAIPVMLLVVAIWLAQLFGLADANLAMTFVMVLVRKLGENLSLTTAGMWTLAVVTLIVGYLVMQWRFQKIEAPVGLDKKDFSWRL